MAGFGKSEITVDRTIGKFRQKNLNKKVKLKKLQILKVKTKYCKSLRNWILISIFVQTSKNMKRMSFTQQDSVLGFEY